MSVVMSWIGGTETAASICGAIMMSGRRLTRSDKKHKFLSEFMPPLMLLKRKKTERIEDQATEHCDIRTAIKEDCNPTPRNL